MDFQQIALHLLDLIFIILSTLFIFGFPFLILYAIYRMIKSLIKYNAEVKAETDARKWEQKHERENTGTKTE